jgi:proton-coupled amino acid transporter
MVIFTIIIAVIANEKLDSFVSLVGAFACIPISFTLPAMFHYRLCAFTPKEKYIDIGIIIFSIIL